MLFHWHGNVKFDMQSYWRTRQYIQVFHRAQTCKPEGDSRSGFPPAGLPPLPPANRA